MPLAGAYARAMHDDEERARARDRTADDRDRIADSRDRIADERDRVADERDDLSAASGERAGPGKRSSRRHDDEGPRPRASGDRYEGDKRHDEAADLHDLHSKTHERASWAAMHDHDPEKAELDRRDAVIDRDAAEVDRAKGRLDRDRDPLKE